MYRHTLYHLCAAASQYEWCPLSEVLPANEWAPLSRHVSPEGHPRLHFPQTRWPPDWLQTEARRRAVLLLCEPAGPAPDLRRPLSMGDSCPFRGRWPASLLVCAHHAPYRLLPQLLVSASQQQGLPRIHLERRTDRLSRLSAEPWLWAGSDPVNVCPLDGDERGPGERSDWELPAAAHLPDAWEARAEGRWVWRRISLHQLCPHGWPHTACLCWPHQAQAARLWGDRAPHLLLRQACSKQDKAGGGWGGGDTVWGAIGPL